MDLLMGFNAVISALESDRRTVERVWLEKGHDRARVALIKRLARAGSIPVEEVERGRLEEIAKGQPRSSHQGVIASAAAYSYADPVVLLDSCPAVARVVLADGIEDPRNLGALIRTAVAAGCAGVFIPQRRSAGLSATVAKAAAGAAERIPLARVGNVASFLNLLKEKGFWTIGLAAGTTRDWDRTIYPKRLALVVGGEARGLRRLTREGCDEIVSIPLSGGLESLNVSVAAGICLYEALRQARALGAGSD